MTATLQPESLDSLKLDGETSSSNIAFEPFDLPSSNQRTLGAPHEEQTVIPLALRPTADSQKALDLESPINTIQSLQSHGEVLTKLLARHGALLFRGLPIHNAEDFSRFAHAFGYQPHEIIGIVVNRPMLAPNVAPANESPKEVLIYNHNESPQVPHAPEYVFFHCRKAPAKGGETPISSSLELFDRAKREIPEFIHDLAAKGILSRVTYKFEKQYAGGSTLRQAFGKEVQDGDDLETQRMKMERQILRYGRGKHTTWEWTDDGVVLTHRLPAIRTQPGSTLPTLFTALAAYFRNAQHNGAARSKAVEQLYGDGSSIPQIYLERLAIITDEVKVLHKWQEGDVLVFDNIICQHGRQPWEGEQSDRVVLASLFDGPSVPGAYTEADWARVVQALDTADVQP